MGQADASLPRDLSFATWSVTPVSLRFSTQLRASGTAGSSVTAWFPLKL